MGALGVAAVSVLCVVVLYAALLTAVYVGRNKMVFPAAGSAVEPTTPGDGLLFEDLRIPVDEGTSVHAWWIPAGTDRLIGLDDTDDTDDSDDSTDQTTLLFFHGNGYALEQQADREAPLLHKTGVNVLLVDYRGYGTSSPLRTSAESTAADAQAALKYLIEVKGIAPKLIWIVGRSIGSVVATTLASALAAPGSGTGSDTGSDPRPQCAGLILLSPITNTTDVKPVKTLLRPLTWLRLAGDFDNHARIGSVRMPVLIIGGSRDTLASPWMARALYARANDPKRIEMVEGAGHNDIWEVGQAHVLSAITEMIRAA